jgi:hypothetical protein
MLSRRPLPVHATKTLDGWISTGIDYGDYKSMGLTKRQHTAERRLPTPDWAVNNPMLRQLIVKFMEDRAGFRRQQKGRLKKRLARAQAKIVSRRPDMLIVLERMCKLYRDVKLYGALPHATQQEINALAAKITGTRTASMYDEHNKFIVDSKRLRDLEIEIEGLDTYLRITEHGGAGFIVAIVYLYYRVGMDSVAVGLELGLKPPHVRQTLARLHECWNNMHPSHAPDKCEGVTTVDTQPKPGGESATGTVRTGFVTPPLFDFGG